MCSAQQYARLLGRFSPHASGLKRRPATGLQRMRSPSAAASSIKSNGIEINVYRCHCCVEESALYSVVMIKLELKEANGLPCNACGESCREQHS